MPLFWLVLLSIELMVTHGGGDKDFYRLFFSLSTDFVGIFFYLNVNQS